MPRELDAIFFDIDDTFYSTSEFSERARRRSVEAMVAVGLRVDPDELMAELREIVTEFSSNFDHHFDKLLLRIPKKHYKGINPAMIVAAGVVAYHETKFQLLRPYPDVLAVLSALAQTPLILGVVTAGWEVKQAEKLLRLGVYGYLTPSAIFISDQIGINKPNVKLYRRATSDLNLRPSRCMYVGDNAPHDIDPPNELGMITVWSRRGGKFHDVAGLTKPQHTIQDFHELADLVRDEYGQKLPAREDLQRLAAAIQTGEPPPPPPSRQREPGAVAAAGSSGG